MSSQRLRLIVCVLAYIAASAAHAREPQERLTAEDRRLFAWFDRLGIEDFIHAPLVRVRTGVAVFGKSNRRSWDAPRGFLLEQKGGKFRVLFGDLTVVAMERVGRDPREESYIGWRSVTLANEPSELIHALRHKQSAESFLDGHDTGLDRLGWPGQAFVLARYCAAHGRDDLAARLLRMSTPAMHKENPRPFADALQCDIARALEWRATLAEANPRTSRHTLAALWQSIADHCPRSYEVADFTTRAETLDKMAVEDDSHQPVSARKLARLAPSDQARELVFQLRDDYSLDPPANWERPSWPFDPPHGNGASKKLAALGHTAVPALLEALRDSRPSREVVEGWSQSARAREIRELASDAIDEIAGLRLWDLTPNADPSSAEAHWAELQTVAADWWKAAQDDREIAWLRTRVEAGSPGAEYCLDALSKRDRAASVDLTLAAIPKVADPRTRGQMLNRLTDVRTPEVDTFLLEELAHGPTLGNRVAAAYLLNQRHRPEGVGALMAAAAALPEHIHFEAQSISEAAPNPNGFLVPTDSASLAQLLMFLLYADSPDTVHVLQTVLPRCDPQTRFLILLQCDSRLRTLPFSDAVPANPATKQSLEDLLIAELADDASLEGQGMQGASLSNFADFAASILAEKWPAKYHYSLHASPEIRASQLAVLRTKYPSSAAHYSPP